MMEFLEDMMTNQLTIKMYRKMKKTLLSLLFLLGMAYICVACDNDDDGYTPAKEVVNAFNAKFPGAKKVEWEKKNTYQVAEFIQDGVEKEAWFDASGKLLLTEEDIAYAQLPVSVREWISASEYAAWEVDDVDKVIREGMATVYVVELESGKNEVDVYFSETGEWIKTEQDASNSNDKYLPSAIPAAIQTYLTENYPAAVILDYEKNRNDYEVDILDGTIHKEINFDLELEWLATHYDVSPLALPKTVKDALSQSQWADWTIDDAEFWQERGQKDYYELELKQGAVEKDIKIDVDGNIINMI